MVRSKSPIFYNRSLERALGILRTSNIRAQRLSLDQLAKALNPLKPTVFTLCSTLVTYKFLRYDSDAKRYSLRMKLFELGGVVLSSLSLRKLASPYMDQLEVIVDKTTLHGILRDDELVYIDKREDPSRMK